VLHGGVVLENKDFRKYYSGYAGEIGQVSLPIGNPYMETNEKRVTALIAGWGKEFMLSSNSFPPFSHF
jgi:hypothetical protein